MTGSADELRLVGGSGWTSGLGNLLRRELQAWWGTHFWLTQVAVWLVVLNGFLVLALWVIPGLAEAPEQLADPMATGLDGFFQIAPLAVAVGVALLAQGSIVAERESGTAAWVMSKPVARSSFVLSKLIALTIGVGTLAVALPSAVAYGQIGLAAGQLPAAAPFALAVGMLALHSVFYLSLTLLLGTFSGSRGLVVAVPLAILVGQQFVANLLGPAAWALPHMLAALMPLAAQGVPLPSYAPVVATAVLAALCLAATVWRFEREEL